MDASELKKAGLKATLPRMRVLRILEDSGQRHLSAEDVYRALLDADENVGLATVYRVLAQFEGAGIVVRHHFEGAQSVFELADRRHHDHVLCVQCGRIDEFMDESIERRQREIAEELGYTITDHSLYLYGVCQKCRATH